MQNNLKIQEDLDYRLLSKRQQAELDKLTAAVERLEGYTLKLETSLAQSNEVNGSETVLKGGSPDSTVTALSRGSGRSQGSARKVWRLADWIPPS